MSRLAFKCRVYCYNVTVYMYVVLEFFGWVGSDLRNFTTLLACCARLSRKRNIAIVSPTCEIDQESQSVHHLHGLQQL